MEWVSVTEPPEESGKYLCLFENGGIGDCEFDNDFGENGEFGFWDDYFYPESLAVAGRDWIPVDVTHWMPMPALPSEPRTNADRIRAMSDEELIELLGYILTEHGRKKLLKWLKQPVKEQENGTD